MTGDYFQSPARDMLSLINNSLGVAGLLGQTILLYVLFSRNRVLSLPMFTVWIAYLEIEAIVNLFVRTTMSTHAYFVVFWAGLAPEYILQLGVLYEIARNVLFPHHRRPPKKAFWILGTLVFLSLLISAIVFGTAKHGAPKWTDNVLNTSSVSLSLLRCLLFASITLFSNVLGLNWKNHVQRIATGLAIYTVIDFVVDYAYSIHQNRFLDYYRVAAYLISLGYWICTLSLPEPERRPLAPQVEALVYRVHQAVTADRRLLEGSRDPR
jgi:hypothetical protein